MDALSRRGLPILFLLAVALTVGSQIQSQTAGENSASPPAPVASISNVVELRLNGEVEPLLAEYIVGGIAQANARNAGLILITVNTPGGLDSSMREIIQAILSSRVPVCVFVAPTGSRAASAGFFILMSADVAAMSPGTETGAASPLLEFGGSPVKVDDTLTRKITNDATAYLRSYTSKRGRNADLAATAVTDAKAFSDSEALSGKLIDVVASSKEDLFSKLEGRTIKRFDGTKVQLHFENPAVSLVEMTGRQKFLTRIVQPDMFFILLIVGVLGLYTEYTHPGVFAPGVIGGIAIVLALFAMHMLPVSLAGLLLIAVAFALFILEAKFPTHGVLGVGGVAAMILGAVFLVKSPLTGMGVSLFTAVCVAIPFALIVIFLMRLVLKSRKWKVQTGKEELIGELGEVRETVGTGEAAGSVFVHGELWRAASRPGEAIPVGARVRVKKVNGLTLEVEPVEQRG
jgi:membrane-bound serine protease (ClpP class)